MSLRFFSLRYLFVVLFCLYLPFAQVGRAQSSTLVNLGIVGGIVALTGFSWDLLTGFIGTSTRHRFFWMFSDSELIKAKSKIDRADLVYSLDTALRRYGFLRARSLRGAIDEELYVDEDRRVLQVKIKRNNRYRVHFWKYGGEASSYTGVGGIPPFSEYKKLRKQYAANTTFRAKEKEEASKKKWNSSGFACAPPLLFYEAISVIKKLDQANLAMEQGLSLQPREGMLSATDKKRK